MSLIRHRFFNRSTFDRDSWFRPSLDIFDPFDDLDFSLGHNLDWLSTPSFSPRLPTRFPKKYRISVDCKSAGYDPKSVKTEIKDGKLFVFGKEECRDKNGDYSSKEFRRSYDLPDNVEVDKLVSFATGYGELVVEVPYKEIDLFEDDMFPRIQNNGKQVTMKCSVPINIDPSKLIVTVKDDDLIIEAEDVSKTRDSYSRKTFYKQCTMPKNTDFRQMKCLYSNSTLSIEAPIISSLEFSRKIPIEIK